MKPRTVHKYAGDDPTATPTTKTTHSYCEICNDRVATGKKTTP